MKSEEEDRIKCIKETPRIAKLPPDFEGTILFVAKQTTSFSVFNQKISKDHVARRKLTFYAKQDHRALHDIKIPIISSPNLIPSGMCLITLSCQNLGADIDKNIKFDLTFKSSAINSIKLDNENRIQLIGSGNKSPRLASFSIQDLLPGECLTAQVIAKKNKKFKVKLWSSKTGESPEVFIYNLKIGDMEEVHKKLAPPMHDSPVMFTSSPDKKIAVKNENSALLGENLKTFVMPIVSKKGDKFVSHGTGFMVNSDGLMMTATHVIQDIVDTHGRPEGLYAIHAASDEKFQRSNLISRLIPIENTGCDDGSDISFCRLNLQAVEKAGDNLKLNHVTLTISAL